jgi:hypothetical protein
MRDYETEPIVADKTIRCMVVWGSAAKRRLDHLTSKEDALSRAYAAAFDVKHKRLYKWRWDAGAIHKIRLPRNLASEQEEATQWKKVIKYWQWVAKEMNNGYAAIRFGA